MTLNVVINRLYTLFGNVVILPIAYGDKKPQMSNWERITFEQSQSPVYQKMLIGVVKKGGNLGIRLGQASGGLVTIDIDRDDLVEPFLELNPALKKTLRTRGQKGCQLWFYPKGEHPQDDAYYSIKQEDGEKVGEFRVGGGGKGAQSVCYGWHAGAKRYYEMVVEARPIEFDFNTIQWPKSWVLPWRKTEGDKFREWAKRHPNWILKGYDLVGLMRKLNFKVEKEEEENKYSVQCPWKSEHTTPTKTLDTVIYQHPGQRPDFVCLHAHCKDDHKLIELLDWAELQSPGIVVKFNAAKSMLPIAISYNVVVEKDIQLPPYAIVGVLHQGMKMMLTGPAKIRKSWLVMDLATQLSQGEEWLGFDTCQSKVLVLNMEMPQIFFEWRLQKIQRARGIKNMIPGGLSALHMRGSYALDKDWNALAKLAKEEGYQVIIIDPIYKTLGTRDENSASDVAGLLRNVDVVAEASGAAIIEVHHNAKGDYTQKEVGDRASGSGVFFRDPDAFMTLGYANKAKRYEEAKVEVRARMVPPVDPIGIRWELPLWKRDDSIDLSNREPTEEEKEQKVTQPQKLLNILKDSPQGLTYTEWRNIAMTQGIIAESSFNKAKTATQNQWKQVGDRYFLKQK